MAGKVCSHSEKINVNGSTMPRNRKELKKIVKNFAFSISKNEKLYPIQVIFEVVFNLNCNLQIDCYYKLLIN